jgi:hypothetical protein
LVWKDELDLLKFIPLDKKARFKHFMIQVPYTVYTGIQYLVWCSNPFLSLTHSFIPHLRHIWQGKKLFPDCYRLNF